MAGKIIADTLETGAGADIATSYVVNGSAKMYSTHGIDAVIDTSLNTSSVTDNGTGQFTSTYTNNMNTANEGFSSNCWDMSSQQSFTNISTQTTSNHKVRCYTHGGGDSDNSITSSVVGDLA